MTITSGCDVGDKVVVIALEDDDVGHIRVGDVGTVVKGCPDDIELPCCVEFITDWGNFVWCCIFGNIEVLENEE